MPFTFRVDIKTFFIASFVTNSTQEIWSNEQETYKTREEENKILISFMYATKIKCCEPENIFTREKRIFIRGIEYPAQIIGNMGFVEMELRI